MILITGGLGFIGQHLSKALLEKNYEVTILDNLSSQIHKKGYKYPILKNKKLTFIEGDVRDKNLIKNLVKKSDIIIHLAAETGTAQSMYQIKKYFDVNVSGTANICDALINEKNNVKKLILSSSRAVYGEGKYICKKHGIIYPDNRKEKDLIKKKFNIKCNFCKKELISKKTDEKSNLSPVSVYAITKQVQEQLFNTVCSITKKDCIILRFQNVYGPGQSLKNPYTGILSIFSNLLKNNKDLNIFEDGNETRDFVYIDDVVKATIKSLEINPTNSMILNIGSGKRTSVITIAQTLKKELSSKSKIIITGDFRLGDIRHNVADIKQAKKYLNYTPKTSISMGIKKFVQWVKLEPIEKDLFDKSIKELVKRNLLK